MLENCICELKGSCSTRNDRQDRCRFDDRQDGMRVRYLVINCYGEGSYQLFNAVLYTVVHSSKHVIIKRFTNPIVTSRGKDHVIANARDSFDY